MIKDLEYFEEMGDFIDFQTEPVSVEEEEIEVDFCKCSKCKGEFMLDPGEKISNCPECGEAFTD